ncbi:MAG: hypothetical protein JWM59_644 [Verrucomicrobiales bacterium]|nr:hypothetical protein [Verrucomicrobiales bacterium]
MSAGIRSYLQRMAALVLTMGAAAVESGVSRADDELASAAPDLVGDAWSDTRNPVVKAFHGQRLNLWSLQPVHAVSPPEDNAGGWAVTELDRFTAQWLKSQSIPLPAAAESQTLGRRLFFDLTGLPPAMERLQQFTAAAERDGLDAAANALTEELLASPRFGEHFARMWLDVVRYSDSNGFDWDEFRPQAFHFRDYVVRSFNADKPYDRFLTEQLAGDELAAPDMPESEAGELRTATGYLRCGPWDNSAALFNEQGRARAEMLADLTETTGSAFLGLTLSCCRCHDHKYDPLTQEDHYRLRAFFAGVKFTDGFQAGDEVKDIPVIRVLQQGDPRSEKGAVVPGFLSVRDPNAADIPAPPNPESSGRRLALARWITAPENPFTDRVMVNRLWQQLMDHPLVATPNDFGLAGAAPQDPALLDWLAGEFRRGGRSVKCMVRLITRSATYRQAPGQAPASFALRQPRRLTAEQLRDSLLAVSGLLTAKADGPAVWPDLPQELILANPAFLDDNKEKTKGWYPSPAAEQEARSLFLIQKRNTRVPFLETFDLPDNSTSCARRGISTVSPQALALLNGPLMMRAAGALAVKAGEMGGGDSAAPAARIAAAWRLALQRPPTEAEQSAAAVFLKSRTLTELCRVILNLNEFLYVD